MADVAASVVVGDQIIVFVIPREQPGTHFIVTAVPPQFHLFIDRPFKILKTDLHIFRDGIVNHIYIIINIFIDRLAAVGHHDLPVELLCLFPAADRIQNKADVHVVDISKGGIAFKSGYDFKVNSFYDTVITLANGEKLYVVVEILHRDSCENDEYMYGCRFVGIGAEDQFKIEAYQIVDTGSAI